MAAKKSLDERIAETKTKLEQIENQYKLLLNKRKEAERKARTHRLIERGAMLESMLEGADTLTNEQVKGILAAVLGASAAPAGEPDTIQGGGA